MSKSGYRVIVEEIDDDVVIHRTEVTEFQEGSMSLGVAAAGAISGICVFCEPVLESVLSYLLWRCSLTCRVLKAIGEVASAYEWSTIDGALEDVCRVFVKSDFMSDPIYAFPIKEFPDHVKEGSVV